MDTGDGGREIVGDEGVGGDVGAGDGDLGGGDGDLGGGETGGIGITGEPGDPCFSVEMVIWGVEMVIWGVEMVIWGVEKLEESVLQGNPHVVLCPCFSVDLENDQ